MTRKPAVTPGATLLLTSTTARNAIWRSGFEEGINAAIAVLRANPGLAKDLARMAAEIAASPQQLLQMVRAEALRSHVTGARTGEKPWEKSARVRRTRRMLRDEQQAQEMAALVRAGETTEGARRKMGIGVVRAQRVRTLAVKLGLIRSRQRAHKP